MPNNNGSLLLGLDGVVVDSAHIDDDRIRRVHVLTDPGWVGVCPECRGRSSRSKGVGEHPAPRYQDRPGRPLIVWRKRKWLCTNMFCKRKRFTESVPTVPPRARLTVRAKAEMALAVLYDDRSVKSAAAAYGTTWNICHEAVKATADPVLAAEPGDVVVLGIDETRRGKAKWETCPNTGVRRWVDRWDTGLIDITGAGGLLVQVNGRAAQPVIEWLAPRDEQWKAGIKFVAIDTSSTYAKAAWEALPDTQLIVDRFHLVKRANEMLDAVRRRTTAAHRLRRGPVGVHALPAHLEPEFVEPAKGGQVSAGKARATGNVVHVGVFRRWVGVETSIIGRPRPLPDNDAPTCSTPSTMKSRKRFGPPRVGSVGSIWLPRWPSSSTGWNATASWSSAVNVTARRCGRNCRR